jgi:hypothetical protein
VPLPEKKRCASHKRTTESHETAGELPQTTIPKILFGLFSKTPVAKQPSDFTVSVYQRLTSTQKRNSNLYKKNEFRCRKLTDSFVVFLRQKLCYARHSNTHSMLQFFESCNFLLTFIGL